MHKKDKGGEKDGPSNWHLKKGDMARKDMEAA